LDTWAKLFTNRQLLGIGTLISVIRDLSSNSEFGIFDDSFGQAIFAMLVLAMDRTINYMSTICIWESKAQEIKQTFLRFALPITWDFAEGNPLADVDRLFAGGILNIARCLVELKGCSEGVSAVSVLQASAASPMDPADIVVTDPPYYDAIPYSDLMDFFMFG
jgi:putative DNA methylase